MVEKKKGSIMIKFLVVTILAIVIFAPACVIASKLYRTSSQAKDNYGKFVNEVKSMEKVDLALKKSTMLIMDKGTAVVYFEPNQDHVKVAVDVKFGTNVETTNYEVVIKRPSSCGEENRCLCLIRDKEIEETGGTFTDGQGTVTATKAFCDDTFKNDLILDNCGIGTPEGVHSYYCTNGFVIERLLIDEVRDDMKWVNTDAHFEAPRRINIQLSRDGDNIVLEAK